MCSEAGFLITGVLSSSVDSSVEELTVENVRAQWRRYVLKAYFGEIRLALPLSVSGCHGLAVFLCHALPVLEPVINVLRTTTFPSTCVGRHFVSAVKS